MMVSGISRILPYALLFGIFLVLLLVFDFNGLYGQDSHEYLRFAKSLKLLLSDGTPPGEFAWPKLYPFLGALIGFTGIPIVLGMQLISLFSIAGSIYFARRIIQSMHNADGTLFLILGALSQVYFVRIGFLVMSDALCVLFITGFFHFYLLTVRNAGWKPVLGMVLFAIAALLTRYASAPLILIPLFFSLGLWIRKLELWKQLLSVALLIGGIIAVVLLNNHFVVRATELLSEWKFNNLFTRSLESDGRTETNLVPNVLYIFSNFAHIGYLSFGVLLFPWIRKWSREYYVIWIAVFIYLIFIGGLAHQNQRFLVITHLIVLALLFPAFRELWNWFRQRKLHLVFLIAVLLFNGAFFIYSFRKTYQLSQLEQQIAESLHKYDDETMIYAFSVNQSFDSYDIPNPSRNLWLMEDASFEKGALVVFNEELFENDWKDHRLMRNWKILKETHELEILEELPQNWKIYRIR